MPGKAPKWCSYCEKPGHNADECQTKARVEMAMRMIGKATLEKQLAEEGKPLPDRKTLEAIGEEVVEKRLAEESKPPLKRTRIDPEPLEAPDLRQPSKGRSEGQKRRRREMRRRKGVEKAMRRAEEKKAKEAEEVLEGVEGRGGGG